MAWTTLCRLDELTENEPKYVEIGRFQLAVVRQGEAVHALDNLCPHAGGSLAGGWVDDGCVWCPWHAWPFRLSDGRMPGEEETAVRVYAARRFDPPEGGPTLVQADLVEKPAV